MPGRGGTGRNPAVAALVKKQRCRPPAYGVLRLRAIYKRARIQCSQNNFGRLCPPQSSLTHFPRVPSTRARARFRQGMAFQYSRTRCRSGRKRGTDRPLRVTSCPPLPPQRPAACHAPTLQPVAARRPFRPPAICSGRSLPLVATSHDTTKSKSPAHTRARRHFHGAGHGLRPLDVGPARMRCFARFVCGANNRGPPNMARLGQSRCCL